MPSADAIAVDRSRRPGLLPASLPVSSAQLARYGVGATCLSLGIGSESVVDEGLSVFAPSLSCLILRLCSRDLFLLSCE